MSKRGCALGWGPGGSLLSQGHISTRCPEEGAAGAGTGDLRVCSSGTESAQVQGQQWKDRCGSDKPWALMREGAGVNSDLSWGSLDHVHWVPNCCPLGPLHTRGVHFHTLFSPRARATQRSPLSLGPVLCIRWASGEQSVAAGGLALQTCS